MKNFYGRNINPNSVHAFKSVDELNDWCEKTNGWRITADEAYDLTKMNANSALMVLNGNDYETLPTNQAELLRALIKHTGWNIQQFGVLTGINRSTLSHVLAGNRSLTIKNAKKIAKVIGFNWWDLFTLDD